MAPSASSVATSIASCAASGAFGPGIRYRPPMSWRDDVRAAVAATGGELRREPVIAPWPHADRLELVGLEAWGRELAERDRVAGIGALALVAAHGFPIAMAAGEGQLDGMGFLASEEHLDGAPVETQISLALRWLDDPSPANHAAVDAAFDRTRQLSVWDEDLLPPDDMAYFWYSDVGQACCAAILGAGTDGAGATYYEWPTHVCVARGLVMAIRGLRTPGADLPQLVAAAGAALTSRHAAQRS